MARRKRKYTKGLLDRFRNDELNKADKSYIEDVLEQNEMFFEGFADRKVLTADMDIYRYFGIIHANNYDGDTVRAWIDYGHGEHEPDAKVRLWGIDTPEIKGGTKETKAAGRRARDYVRGQVGGRGSILISHKLKRNSDGATKLGEGKYGRYLFEVIEIDTDGKLYNLNERLISLGMAELNTYGDEFNGWSKP